MLIDELDIIEDPLPESWHIEDLRKITGGVDAKL